MKHQIIILVFFIVYGTCYSQNFEMNYCIQGISVNFLNEKDAKLAFKNHIGENNYISITINHKNHVDFNGEIYSLEGDLLKVIEEDTNLPKSISVYIGVQKSAHFDTLMQIVCSLKNLNSFSITELRLYHYD
ncbi:hypothetical protein [Dokdonia sp.]|uniref:hypothetical protein n=1 Tax=Dokdonia sp. TaxID=2024995 RepID=UPI00326468B4